MKNFTIRLAGQYFTICPVCDILQNIAKIISWQMLKGVQLQKLVELCQRVRRKMPQLVRLSHRFISRLSQLSRISTLSVKNPPEKISKRAFPSGIFPMPTQRHLRSIARLQTTSYLAIPCFFMARSLRQMAKAIFLPQKAVPASPHIHDCGENISGSVPSW